MSEATQEETEVVRVERRDGVMIMTLNRPEARNSLNLALTRALSDAFDELDADPELSAGVVTGAGKGFCSGMDLKAFVAGENVWEGEADDRGLRRIVTRAARKPLLAAVEGFAVAGGFELALACDVLVAGRSAKFGVPEVKRSLVAAGGALRQLPRRAGPGAAMKLALTGDLIDGERAYAIGLVDELTEDGGALDGAVALALAIAANGPLAVAATKQVLREGPELSDADFWARQKEICDPVFASADAIEGSKAFAEKRAPVWTGS
ncbi:MAG TPA: crotonase/enoyl-CoA hydratase family protein [Solirubrobacterales bacterium]|nr:crotonase/enoyl-CoA hydratase family protein [Solirubrobacterales bacterium]